MWKLDKECIVPIVLSDNTGVILKNMHEFSRVKNTPIFYSQKQLL